MKGKEWEDMTEDEQIEANAEELMLNEAEERRKGL